MSLVFTDAPRADESGMGYYRRLAAGNSLLGWRELAALADVQRSRSALLGRLDPVSSRLGLEPAWTRFANRQEVACRTWGRLHRVQSDAICPACLAGDAYQRHHWEHSYVTACPHHGVRLVDQCDACGEGLSPHRYQIDQCDCGHDLSQLPAVAVTPAQIWLSALIATGGLETVGIAPGLRDVDVGVLCQAIRTLCLQFDPAVPPPRRGAAFPKSVTDAVDLLAPLDALLADWPMGFRMHVERRMAAGKPGARTLNSLLGPWYVSLRKLCQGTALEPFIRIVIEVAAEKFDGVLGLDSAKAMAEDTTNYMRAPDAAKAIGVSASRLYKSLEAGECEFRTRRLGTRGQVHEIARGEVERIQQSRGAWITVADACELAGVPESVLGHMMGAGVIRADVNWRQDILKGGQVERRSVLDLFERISQAAVPATTPDEVRVTWSELTSRRMGDRHAIRSLMQAIAAGTVRAVVLGHRVGDMAFLRRDVSEYFGTPLLEAGMSIQQLSRTTGWKWESIAHWINEGLLESQSIMLRGQSCRVVLPHQLLAFRQAFVPVADLAHAMETKSSALSRQLRGVELVGAKVLPNGAARGGLVRMADLARLAILGAKAGYDLFVPASCTG